MEEGSEALEEVTHRETVTPVLAQLDD